MTSADATGAVTFEVDFENMDGVKGTRVTAVTDGSSVTFDKTVATLGVVTIASDNDDTSLAKVGDTIVLMFIASEALMAKPNVSIAGHVLSAPAITQGVDATQWNAVYVMQAGDTNGVVTFTINAKDLAGNNISQVSATTNSSSVTFDKTAPVMVSATEISNFSLTFSLSEFALASTITKANDG